MRPDSSATIPRGISSRSSAHSTVPRGNASSPLARSTSDYLTRRIDPLKPPLIRPHHHRLTHDRQPCQPTRPAPPHHAEPATNTQINQLDQLRLRGIGPRRVSAQRADGAPSAVHVGLLSRSNFPDLAYQPLRDSYTGPAHRSRSRPPDWSPHNTTSQAHASGHRAKPG